MRVPFLNGKKVRFYNHKYGIVTGNAKTKAQMASSLLCAVFVLGGFSFAGIKTADFIQAKTQSASTSYQRESANQTNSKRQANEADKLSNASVKAREDEALAKDIKNKLKNVPGGQKWSVYVRDLNSDRMASINADASFAAGSLANIFAVAPLENKIPSVSWNNRGGTRNLQNCVELMIRSNDKDCTTSVRRFMDLKAADAINESYGFKKTSIGGDEQETTARDIGDLLYRLQNGQVLSDKARRTVFDGLYAQTQRDGLPKACDDKCLVANISAEDKNFKHDAAIVTSGKSKYVVVIMTDTNANWGQLSDVGAFIRQAFQP